jgi:formate C-acetyltransferase
VNVLSRDLLEEAKEHPEQHGNLLVRVGGFSAYFVELDPGLQDEIIARTAHG